MNLDAEIGMVVDRVAEALVKRIYETGHVVVKRSDILRVHNACKDIRGDGYCQDAMDELDLAMTKLTLAVKP